MPVVLPTPRWFQVPCSQQIGRLLPQQLSELFKYRQSSANASSNSESGDPTSNITSTFDAAKTKTTSSIPTTLQGKSNNKNLPQPTPSSNKLTNSDLKDDQDSLQHKYQANVEDLKVWQQLDAVCVYIYFSF